MVSTTVIEKPLFNFEGRLSEGPLYDVRNNSLMWVDIIAGKIHRVFLPNFETPPPNDYSDEELASTVGSHEMIQIDDSVGFIGLTPDVNILVCGCGNGYGTANFSGKSFEYRHAFLESNPYIRFNEGAIDDEGNLWCGTMSNFNQPEDIKQGTLYRVDQDGTIHKMIEDAFIPNGLAWHEGKVYWTDTITHTIWKFDYDAENNRLVHRTPHIDLEKFCPETPNPDGFAMAENGDIYTAVFGGSAVLRFDIYGQLLEKFLFPAQRITCAVLGGKDGNELFVTSADLHLDDPSKLQSEQGDVGGSIFRIKLDPTVRAKSKSLWNGLI